mmetsp:Transcript_78123/g.207334  ORF Transcript_78123/g.207334 Transcript_78123/m.207334 type:complete len:183 (-) Transcript_78123:83-631(-)|eukprot:CAMPEP_0171181382 /NCGR_PEP_ID=MMETSP0790-20130122/14232_1 /TAXON_ID=2925 /ORGANISM="Alexandrium catenella, Strain OF101" /LENGTH=182 /DNA_ID=CAMNT_0011646321 /DNA_START=98 /DNA_END=646 /DNA_ORIENTATION=+
MQRWPRTLAVVGLLAIAARGPTGAAAARVKLRGCEGAAGDCEITRMTIRNNLGDLVQLEKTGASSFKGTMCADAAGFRVEVKQKEPVASGPACSLSGMPSELVEVAAGASEVLQLSTTAGTAAPAANYTLTVQRLDPSVDQAPCAITMQRTAIQDCGYAPILERQRQEAAIAGMPPPATPAP